jgi:nitroreductase
VDTFLNIASRREVRDFAGRPLPDDVVGRILDAGRLAGSAKNRQPWTFVLVESAERRARLAEAVYEPSNVRGAQLVVAIVLDAKGSPFDAGRAAQNMLLAASNEGVGGVPNGAADRAAAYAALGLAEDEQLPVILAFGYPAKERRPRESRPAAEWSARANRKPLTDLVRRV